MITHTQIWAALDHIAVTYARSPSGLAKRAGLDSTTFNKSKRGLNGGRQRWPSSESIAKVLNVIGMSFEDFAALAANNHERGPAIPVIGQAEAGSDGFFDDAGFPVGEGWDEVRVPGAAGSNVYALEISGDSMMPIYRNGDRILVAPEESVRRGDRVVVKTTEGEVMAKELAQMTTSKVVLSSANPEFEDRTFARKDVQWIARIVWASQ